MSSPVDGIVYNPHGEQIGVSAGSEPNLGRKPKRRRWWLVIPVVVVIAVAGLLAAIFLPVHSESQEIQVDSASGSSTTLSLPSSTWVTVHFDHPGSMHMSYWMNGPGGGMMFNHQGLSGGDSYSFWSSGGSYRCWAGYADMGQGIMPVWVNASWGLI